MTIRTDAMQFFVDEARAVSIEAEINRRGIKLRRSGAELVGPCPACGGDDRFGVNLRKGVFNCRGSGTGGDVIALVEYLDATDFVGACETLTGRAAPKGTSRGPDPDELARREAARLDAEAERERGERDWREEERARMRRFWKGGKPIVASSPVGRYLASRGLPLPTGATLRELPSHAYFEGGAEIWRGPAMIAAMVDAGGVFRGGHVTWIDPVSAGKAEIIEPSTGEVLKAKKVRGSMRGSHIALSQHGRSEDRPSLRRLVIGEGIETVLSVRVALEAVHGPAYDAETLYWSGIALGNVGGKHGGMIAHPSLVKLDARGARRKVMVQGPIPAEELDGRPALMPPDTITEVILLGDGDSERFATEQHLLRAVARWARPGRVIRIAWAPDGADFNALLTGTDAANERIAAIVDASPAISGSSDPSGVGSAHSLGEPLQEETVLEGVEAPVEAEAGNGEGSGEAQAWGFDIDDMNLEWAHVLMGSKAVIVREQAAGPIEDRVRVLSLDAFKSKFSNRFTQVASPKGIRTTTWANRWLAHRQRRDFDGIEFFPNPDGALSTPGYLNLYRGFSVRPAAKPHGWAVLRDHMMTNICHGDAELFRWLLSWFAHLIQRPRERIGTALVFRGRMGAGKSIVGEIMGSLIASHYFLVGDARYITGNFNAHMASCLLLQAEEAVWAGDKAAEGRLKDLVTAEIQMIEQKSIDPIRLKNFVRLIMTSNEDWVVPAGKDERRFAVFDVHPRCAQNHEYFAEMRAEIEDGGREALLADLLAFDIDKVNLRQIPMTAALLEQKIRSLDTVEAWWNERLRDGSTRRGTDVWAEAAPVDALYNDYIAVTEKIGVKRKADKAAFGTKLGKLVPGLSVNRPWVTMEDSTRQRARCYVLPPLQACREAFEEQLGQSIAWEDGEPADDEP